MQKYIKYFSLAAAVAYILIGLWILLSKLLFIQGPKVPNGEILGGLMLLYGCFRLYRFWKLTESEPVSENE